MQLKFKNILYYMLTFAVIIISLEFFSLMCMSIYLKKIVGYSTMSVLKNKVYEETTFFNEENKNKNRKGGIGIRIVHPYMGFVYEPGTRLINLSTKTYFKKGICEINSHGFVGTPPFPKNTNKSLNVIILGGSVAQQFSCLGAEKLKNDLSKIKKFKKSKINIINLGIGAYHQPQQLMALNYYLAHGGEFDILINIDGLNEAFIMDELIFKNKIYPAYPFSWDIHMGGLSRKQLTNIGKINFYQTIRSKLLAFTQKNNYSMTLNNLWFFSDKILRKEVLNLKNESKFRNKDYDFAFNGPEINQINIENFILKMWNNSSTQLFKIAKINNAKYFHILQPTLHRKNSKVLTNNEKKMLQIQLKETPTFVKSISHLYPIMIKSMKSGKEDFKNNFFNASNIFRNNKDDIYVDGAGHINKKGNEILISFIINKIKEQIK